MWDEVYQRYYPELLKYCISACQDKELAEDLVQETFLRALQTGEDFEDLGPSQQRAWLYRTMKNLLYDRYRRAQVESAYIESLQGQMAYWEPGIQEAENQMVLAMLSPEDRMLFHLRFEEGYNATELAEILHLPPGTIRARLSRARSLLKKKLYEE